MGEGRPPITILVYEGRRRVAPLAVREVGEMETVAGPGSGAPLEVWRVSLWSETLKIGERFS